MVFEDVPNTGLTLGSISTDENPKNHSRSHHHRHQHNKKLLSQLKFDHVFPSDLTLGLSSSSSDEKHRGAVKIGVSKFTVLCPPQASSLSAASSYSNSSVKRERDLSGEEEEDVEVKNLEIERVSSKASDDQDEDEGSARKKLRLTKEQSVVLEDNFKEHSTLNPKLKQALAKQLNLRLRQVEVWFQNRRARKKLKQNEIECELLKKSWETLKDENKRLQKELQELKALRVTAPFYVQIPTSTLTMCPSCERVGGNGGDSIGSDDGSGGSSGSSSSKMIPFSIGAKAADFYNPITHPSAAC